jgi:NAD(P)-dependent dehydrogenase (short-subunit alcohol dehydrogenase family)
MYDYSEHVALVTGGASGLGRAACEAFARAGARVVVADVQDDDGEQTAARCRELGAEAVFVHCDVAEESEVEAMVQEAITRFGRLDCAFNNAGISGTQAHVADLPADAFCRTIEVNLTGVYRCVHHEARVMRAQQRGAIVNCASILGVVGFGGAAAYTAAKHGVVGLTKAAAIDLAKEGVRVNAICPGFIDTPMLEQAGMTTDAVVRASVEALHPMGRLGQSHEIADPVLWLCSDKATFVTGQALMVDGGYVAQ